MRNTSSSNLKSSGSQSALLTDKKTQALKPNGFNLANGTANNFSHNKGISPTAATAGPLGNLFGHGGSTTRNTVVIHVCDEAKKKT